MTNDYKLLTNVFCETGLMCFVKTGLTVFTIGFDVFCETG
jgi:hypothetical protein